MTSLQVLTAKIGGAVVLSLALLGWWHLHNSHEQAQGAQVCIAATTETKTQAVADNSGIEAAHAAQLTKVVNAYESKLAAAAADSADLTDRLRDYALRPSAVPGLGAAAARAGLAASSAGGAGQAQQRSDPGGISKDVRDLITACSQDADELEALQDAWRAQLKKPT